MQLKPMKLGPVALTNAVANYLNPPTGAAGVGLTASNQYILIKHLHVLNKTGAAASFSAWIGATGGSAAGTEFWGSTLNVNANSFVERFFSGVRLEAADFLTFQASANTTLTLCGEFDIGVTG